MSVHLTNTYQELKIGNVPEAEAHIDLLIDEIQSEASNNRYFDKNAKCVFKGVVLEYLYGKTEYSYEELTGLFFNTTKVVEMLSKYLLHFQAYEQTELGNHIINIYIEQIEDALKVIQAWLKKESSTTTTIYMPKSENVECFCGNKFVYYYKPGIDKEENIYVHCPKCNNTLKIYNKMLLAQTHPDILQNSIAMYAKNKLGYSYQETIKSMELISKHQDLAVELYISTHSGEYIQQNECVNIFGYNSRILREIMPFNVIGIYKLLAMLRDEPLGAKRIIDTRSSHKGILSAQKEVVEAVDKILNESKNDLPSFFEAKVNTESLNEIKQVFDGHFTTPIYMMIMSTMLMRYKKDTKPIRMKEMLNYLSAIKNKPSLLKEYIEILPEIVHRFVLLFSNMSPKAQDDIIVISAWVLKRYSNAAILFPLEHQQ